MKKKGSKARMQVIFGALLLALIFITEGYTMIHYSDMFLVLTAMTVVELICLYVVISGVMAIYEEKDARREEQYESIFKSEKASYLMLRKYFEAVADKLNYIEEASKVPTEEIINAQKGIAKAVIKRSHENTEALMNAYDQLSEQFGAFDQKIDGMATTTGAYKDEILSAQKQIDGGIQIEEIEDLEHRLELKFESKLDSKLQEMVVSMKDMELRLNQAIMASQKVVLSAPAMSAPVAQTPQQPVAQQPEPLMPQSVDTTIPVAQPEEEVSAEPETMPESPEVMEQPEEPEVSAAEQVVPEPEAMSAEAETPVMPETETPEPMMEPEELQAEETPILPEEASDPEISEDLPESDLNIPEEPVLGESDLEETPVVEADEVIPPNPEEAIEEAEELVEPEPIPEEAIVDEPQDPIPSEELPPMPDMSDPNRSMSPDEIAALFANMGSDQTPTSEPEPEPAPEPEPEELPPMPDMSDPNRSMSPDEIAALFANMGNDQAPEKKEEPVEPEPATPEEPADPNKALSPEEIAALFASMGT